MFDAILFVRGIPSEETHLRRAGIYKASKVVVLADRSLEVLDGDLSSSGYVRTSPQCVRVA
jgi:hypothetical protein